MVLSGQTLITMIAELKRNAAVSDFAALNQNIARQDALHAKETADLHAQLAVLQQQLHQVCRYADMPCLALHTMMQGEDLCSMCSHPSKLNLQVYDAQYAVPIITQHMFVQVSRSA